MSKKPDIPLGPFEILLLVACICGLVGIGFLI